jgi:hypothetical protein
MKKTVKHVRRSGKVKSSLCLIKKPQHEDCGEVKIQIHASLTTALDKSENVIMLQPIYSRK